MAKFSRVFVTLSGLLSASVVLCVLPRKGGSTYGAEETSKY